MTLKNAYEKAKRSEMSNKYFVGCFDLGEVWAFNFSSMPLDEYGSVQTDGDGTVTINKQTGAESFIGSDDYSAFDNAIEIPLGQVLSAAAPPPPAAANTACPPITKRRKLAYA